MRYLPVLQIAKETEIIIELVQPFGIQVYISFNSRVAIVFMVFADTCISPDDGSKMFTIVCTPAASKCEFIFVLFILQCKGLPVKIII